MIVKRVDVILDQTKIFIGSFETMEITQRSLLALSQTS